MKQICMLREYSKKNNISLIHPFDDPMVIAGQGTVGLEMLESFLKLIQLLFQHLEEV